MKWLAASGAVTAVALGPPLHGAAHDLLAAHMVQHLLLVGVAAPLLAAGLPGPALLVRFPAVVRRLIGHCYRRARRALPLARAGVVGLVGSWLLHTVTLWAWHAPALYEAALRRPSVHALEHGSLLASSVAFWAMVLRLRDPSPPGTAGILLFLFAGAGQCTALGALLTLTTSPWYSSHAATTARWGLTPLEDQHLAGLLMWVLGGLGYLIVALVVVARVLSPRVGCRSGHGADAQSRDAQPVTPPVHGTDRS